MNQSPSNVLLPSLGTPLRDMAGGPAASTPAKPSGEARGFPALLGTIAALDGTLSTDGSSLPPPGGELPVIPPVEKVAGVTDAIVDLAREPGAATDFGHDGGAVMNVIPVALLMTGDQDAAAGPSRDDVGSVASSGSDARSPSWADRRIRWLSMTPANGPAAALRADRPGHPQPTDSGATFESEASVSGQRVLSAIATTVRPPGTPDPLPVAPQPVVDRGVMQQAVGRHQVPRVAVDVDPRDRLRTVQTLSGPVPAKGAAPGFDPALRDVAKHLMLSDTSGSLDTTDLPDLPFESIRITVREGIGDRSSPGRAPTIDLPAPRLPVGHPDWARSLGERLTVMVRGEHQMARLSLNPEHLGPVDIQLRISDDQARLWFHAQHPQAREALEAAVPRLRELFAQQGLDLSQHSSHDDAPRRETFGGEAAPALTSVPVVEDDTELPVDGSADGRGSIRRGMVDDFV